jgi:hypothetical protein
MAHEMTPHAHADREYAQRDRENRRCGGNNRRCTLRAVEQHLVRRQDEHGTATGEPEIRQTCSRHRQQFINSAMWQHISTSRMGGRDWPQTN